MLHCFSSLVFSGKPLKAVNEFRYLGHIMSNTLRDDRDIQPEMHNMFIRVNMLIRRFLRCYVMVKLRLFRSTVSACMVLAYSPPMLLARC